MFREDKRRAAAVSILALLLQPAWARGQALVIAEMRIASPTLLARPQTKSVDFLQRATNLVVDAGRREFSYLTWKSAVESGPGGPRVVIQLRDGPTGLCGPPTLWMDLIVARDGAEQTLSQDVFIEACDIDAIDWTTDQYLANLKASRERTPPVPPWPSIAYLFATTATHNAIQSQLLANIALTDTIEPDRTDVAKPKLYLPLKPQTLQAGKGSLMLARFGSGGTEGSLYLRPQESPPGDRLLVYLDQFQCGADIRSGPPPTGDFIGMEWHPLFSAFLDRCSGPRVYMENYVHAPLPDSGALAAVPPGEL